MSMLRPYLLCKAFTEHPSAVWNCLAHNLNTRLGVSHLEVHVHTYFQLVPGQQRMNQPGTNLTIWKGEWARCLWKLAPRGCVERSLSNTADSKGTGDHLGQDWLGRYGTSLKKRNPKKGIFEDMQSFEKAFCDFLKFILLFFSNFSGI